MLRRDMTFPERLLWNHLKGSQLAGWKFRRQHPMGPFVADYYCHAAKLVVELDGMSHVGQASVDAERSNYLESQNLRVIRFTNDDVLQHLDAVLEAILMACKQTHTQDDPPSPQPSPGGRGG